MQERPSNSQTDDNSQTADKGGANVKISLVGYDRPFFTALAIALAVMSCFYSFEAGRQATQEVYWRQRIETFLEELSLQGYKVPPDLLPQKEHSK